MENINLRNKTDENNESNEDLDSLKEVGTMGISALPKDIQYLTIIGEIEGHIIAPPQKKATKYEHLIPMLISAVEDPKIKGIFIILNTIGGDVEAGLALAEMITSIDKPKVSLVLGGGHSVGVPLAIATDYSFIVPSASMTVHPIRTTGLVIGGPQTFRYFEKMQQRIIDFIVRTSNIERKVLMELMYATDEIANDVGTILIGQEAVDYGIIDEVGGYSDALKKLRSLMD